MRNSARSEVACSDQFRRRRGWRRNRQRTCAEVVLELWYMLKPRQGRREGTRCRSDLIPPTKLTTGWDGLGPQIEFGWAQQMTPASTHVSYVGEPTRRPDECKATEVLAAGEDRLGRNIYLIRWSDGSERWGPRPRTAGHAVSQAADTARRAREQRNEYGAGGSEGGRLRAILRQRHGPEWLWLATQAPLAVGRRDTQRQL